MDTIEYARFRYDTVKVENSLYLPDEILISMKYNKVIYLFVNPLELAVHKFYRKE